MKVKDCMTKHVISVGTQEPVSVAARLMSRYNLGILPVQTPDGRLCGMVTDRDVVLRCVAAGKDAEAVAVRKLCQPASWPSRPRTIPRAQCG